jgi:hypothetical protein
VCFSLDIRPRENIQEESVESQAARHFETIKRQRSARDLDAAELQRRAVNSRFRKRYGEDKKVAGVGAGCAAAAAAAAAVAEAGRRKQ